MWPQNEAGLFDMDAADSLPPVTPFSDSHADIIALAAADESYVMACTAGGAIALWSLDRLAPRIISAHCT